MPAFFDGRQYISPAIATQLLDEDMISSNVAIGNDVVIIGRSTGGKPKTVLRFSSPVNAMKALISGDGLTGVLNAFSPSNETPGPNKIFFIRVNPATQSSLTLKDSNDSNCIDLVSTDYGLYTRGIKIKIENGTSHGKRVTTMLDRKYMTQDNITRSPFTVRYSGSEATATLSITNSTLVLSAPFGTDTTITLSEFPTVQELVDRINTETGFTAVMSANSADTPTLNGLDHVTDQDVKTATYTVKADLQAIIDWINSVSELYVTASRSTGASAPPANIDFTYLSGGSDGVIQNSDWQDAFTVAQTLSTVKWVAPLSASPAVWDMAKAHCKYCSDDLRYRRRAIVGGNTGVSIEQAALDAFNLGSERAAYVYPGYYAYNSKGALTLYPPYMLTSIIAGALAGVSPGNAMTNKSINIRGVESELVNPSDTDYLISNGVLCLFKDEGAYRVTKSISTWTGDTRYNKVELSTGAATDYTIEAVEKALKTLIGAKGNDIVLQRAVSITDTTLHQLAIPEPGGLGILAGNAAHPAYKGITAELNGDVLKVSFSCSPVIPVNYIFITVSINPFSGSASL